MGVGSCTLSNSPDGMGNSMIQDRISGLSWKEIADKYQLGSPGAARTRFKKLTGIGDFKVKGKDLKHLVDNNLLDSLKGKATDKVVKEAVHGVDDALKVAQAANQGGAKAVQEVAEKIAKTEALTAQEKATEALLNIAEKYDDEVFQGVINFIDNGQGYLHIKQVTGLEFNQIDEIAWHHILAKHDGNVWSAYYKKPTSENGFNAVKGKWFNLKSKGLTNKEAQQAMEGLYHFPKEVGQMIDDGSWSMPSMGSKNPILSKAPSPPSYGYQSPTSPPPPQSVIHFTESNYNFSGFSNQPVNSYIKWSDDLGNDLTPEAFEAVKSYTGSSYSSINSGLRGGGSGLTETIKHIDGSFREIPFDTRVYRHVTTSAFKEDLKTLGGKVYEDAGYLSTAVVDGGFGASREIKMIIDVPKGTKARYVDGFSLHKGEKEMILPRGTKLAVKSVKQDGYKWVVHMIVMAS